MTTLKPSSGGWALYDDHELVAWWPTARERDAVLFQIAWCAGAVKIHE